MFVKIGKDEGYMQKLTKTCSTITFAPPLNSVFRQVLLQIVDKELVSKMVIFLQNFNYTEII